MSPNAIAKWAAGTLIVASVFALVLWRGYPAADYVKLVALPALAALIGGGAHALVTGSQKPPSA